MNKQAITVYFSSHLDRYGRMPIWTAFLAGGRSLYDCSGHACPGALNAGLHFPHSTSHNGPDGKSRGNEIITEKRLFKGFQILPKPHLLDMNTLEALPDPDAPALTGVAGETLPIDPVLNPDARALGSPDWFF